MDLDILFGVAQKASGNGPRAWETQINPASHLRIAIQDALTSGSKDILSVMLAAQDGCVISGFFFQSVTVIWIVDQDGFLNIAVEEAAHRQQARPTIPILIENKAASQDWRKLGHVSLLKAPHLGRIAGEIILRQEQRYWELNNSSGRYGVNCGRSGDQLEEVAKVLTALGLRIDTDFF